MTTRCPACGLFTLLGSHRCAPEWEWRCDEWHGPDEWERVRAHDAEDAAVNATNRYDEEELRLVTGRRPAVTITVRDPRTQEVTSWSGSGEAVPTYRVTPLTTVGEGEP